jgi:hypothetical protein
MQSSDSEFLGKLLAAATPFLHITDAIREDWCRVMQKQTDGRIGPWKYTAQYKVLDQKTWDRPGEVIYFVTDKEAKLRLVGQSMSKLNVRWKKAPMYNVKSLQPMGRKALFHTSSWPAIEAGFMSTERPPFTVSALFRERLEPLCRQAGGSLAESMNRPETHLQRLSFHVESWVCSLNFGEHRLWNKHKVRAET